MPQHTNQQRRDVWNTVCFGTITWLRRSTSTTSTTSTCTSTSTTSTTSWCGACFGCRGCVFTFSGGGGCHGRGACATHTALYAACLAEHELEKMDALLFLSIHSTKQHQRAVCKDCSTSKSWCYGQLRRCRVPRPIDRICFTHRKHTRARTNAPTHSVGGEKEILVCTETARRTSRNIEEENVTPEDTCTVKSTKQAKSVPLRVERIAAGASLQRKLHRGQPLVCVCREHTPPTHA